MMKRAFRDEWSAALRSGEYPQSRGLLQVLREEIAIRPVGFCCIGVRCDLDVKAGLMWSRPFGDGRYVRFLTSKDADTGMAAEVWATVLERWGLTAQEQYELISMNDNRKHNFQMIADYLDQLQVED